MAALTEAPVLTPGPADVGGRGPASGPAPAPEPAPAPAGADADDMAYVIYTSGSTGSPKGAMLDHRGPLNTITDINHRFGVGPGDRIFGVSSLCFDLSVYDVFGAVAAGATLVLPTAEERDPAAWAGVVAREAVTIWNSVPAVLELVVEEAESTGLRLERLRLVLLSGDWIPVGLPDRVRRVAPNARVVSLGGATEASIWSICYPVDEVDPRQTSIPYGRPLSGQTWHVLDGASRDAPTWVPGDLYIGGVGLAMGYWGDPQRTAAAFVKHPRTGERLYRTGDRGRYLPSGDLEFLGRADHQVKIQGFRVEPGEVEHALCEHPRVRQAAVVAQDHGSGRQLVGFVVTGEEEPEPADPDDLRRFLSKRLPAYLVPDRIAVLDRLPLNGNGKLDRTALAALAAGGTSRAQAYSAPRSALEATVAGVWQEILDHRPIGVHDDFFEIGGQSFAALRAVALLGRRLGRRVPLGLLLQHRTVAALAAALDAARPGSTTLVRLPGTPTDPTGGAAALFLVHPAGGYVVRYRDLPERLGRPCYAFQVADGSAGDRPETVAGFAEQYLRAVEDAGLQPPTLLGGWSSGAVIAHEMAVQVEARGGSVAGLVVLDSPAPTPARQVDDATLLLWFLDDLDVGFNPSTVSAEQRAQLAATPPDQLLAAGVRLARRQGVTHTGVDADTLRPTYEVFARVVRACNAYVPTAIGADIAVLRATDGVPEEFARHPAGGREDWGWTDLTTGAVLTGRVPGTHHTVLTRRSPDRLGRTLRDLLDRLEGPR
jgi:amino acid adenylation domain-containing protein